MSTWNVKSTKYERDDLKIVIDKIIDTSNNDPTACEIRVQRHIRSYDDLIHETHIWLDEVRQVITLRDALNSFIEQHHLEEGVAEHIADGSKKVEEGGAE